MRSCWEEWGGDSDLRDTGVSQAQAVEAVEVEVWAVAEAGPWIQVAVEQPRGKRRCLVQ